MSMRIVHNYMALVAHRHLQETQHKFETALERLTTGLRINKASDDAAGLAISEKMRAAIVSYEQAIRNAQDGISLLQTAEGALAVIDEKLIRLRQLAMQAANETYGDTERGYIDTEFQVILSEITRIACVTEFAGRKLLDGTLTAFHLQVGIYWDSVLDQIWISLGAATAQALGLTNASVNTVEAAKNALSIVDQAIVSKNNLRAYIGATMNRLQNAIENLKYSYENAVAAESRIRDADIAMEMTNFVIARFLMQSGVAMLAQANMYPEILLRLIV